MVLFVLGAVLSLHFVSSWSIVNIVAGSRDFITPFHGNIVQRRRWCAGRATTGGSSTQLHHSTRRKKNVPSRSQPDVASYIHAVENVVPKRSSPQTKESRQPLPRTTLLSKQNAPDLKSQLSLSRNGHTCIRRLLERDALSELNPLLKEYAQQKELLAWRQKVEVAASTKGSNQEAARLAMSCKTTDECHHQLALLLGDDIPIPFLQFFNCWREIPQVKDLAESLAAIAATLLDVERVRLYQDSVFWKRSTDGPTPWHADAPMAPFDTSLMVTAWIPLQDVVKTSGLVFASKSHADYGLLYWQNNAKEAANSNDLSARYTKLANYMPLRLGDVTFHSGWTLHCADGGEERVALAITFVDAQAPIRTDLGGGDNEDAWSYRDWIEEVPRETNSWDHPLAPTL